MTVVWTPLERVQTLVCTSPDSCRGTAGEPPLTKSQLWTPTKTTMVDWLAASCDVARQLVWRDNLGESGTAIRMRGGRIGS
jgi:hypothetical protein